MAELVKEFTTDFSVATAKYLEKDGNSKVLLLEGRVDRISINQDGEKVVILKEHGEPVGVSATFLRNQGEDSSFLKVGDRILIKGAIAAGNSYDADLDLYEHVVMVKCSVVNR